MANIFTATTTITLRRGDDWDYEIPVKDSNNDDYDFTGWTNAKCQVRKNADDTNYVIEFSGSNIRYISNVI